MFIFAKNLLGDLLNTDFQTIYTSNKRTTTEKTNLFGLSWNGDDATIKRMPLINMLTVCKSKLSATIAILECIGHILNSGKNDAEFILSFFKSKVDEFDPGSTLTNY